VMVVALVATVKLVVAATSASTFLALEIA